MKVDQESQNLPEDLLRAYEDQTALVTGGAGFIGSNLVRHLLSLKVSRVTVLDDLSSSYSWNLPQDKRVRFVEGSILDDEDLTGAFSLLISPTKTLWNIPNETCP